MAGKAESSETSLLDKALARKATLEADLLAEQLTPRHRRWEAIKVAAGASGLVLAFVSLIGGLMSVGGWFYDQAQNRELRIEERLDRALAQLSDQRPAQRVAAVGALNSFLHSSNEDRNARVVVSVANAIALEDDQVVRNAMVYFFRNLDENSVGVGSREAGLATLVANNRGMVRDKKLWLEPPGNWYGFASEDPKGQRLDGLVLSIVALLGHKARVSDMSDLYLVLADLSGLDLTGVNFNDTLLNWSDLSNATLRGASFDGADLDSTSFVGADLRKARLTFTERNRLGPRRFSYVHQDLVEDRQVSLPDFECADLRGADFSGFRLWNITADRIRERKQMYWLGNFSGADLGGANFERLGVYFLNEAANVGGADQLFQLDNLSGQGKAGAPFMAMHGSLGPASAPAVPVIRFRQAFAELNEMFGGSNLQAARFPNSLRPYLPRQSAQAARDRARCQSRRP